MERTMIILNFIAVLGFPTVFAMVAALARRTKKYSEQIKTLMNAQQAQMRSQLLKDYYKYVERKFIYEAELEDWINQYNAYHSLGANGIMDKRKETLMNLETKAEIE